MERLTQRGIPVATVAINNATNAALLAIRILGSSIAKYRIAIEEYSSKLESEVEGKREVMLEMGWEEYKSKKL